MQAVLLSAGFPSLPGRGSEQRRSRLAVYLRRQSRR